MCGELADDKHIKAEGMAGRLGAQLMAIAAEGDRRRIYLPATDEHIQAADVEPPTDVPTQELPDEPRAIWCKLYGLIQFADLFTNRQLVALTTFSDLVTEARTLAESDAQSAGLTPTQSTAYANALATYLALAASKMTVFHSTQARWRPDADKSAPAFGRQALPMVWDFAEVAPFAGAGGDWMGVISGVASGVDNVRSHSPGRALQGDARGISDVGLAISTDPPYYDNIGYADLSDYCYVWLRSSLREVYPSLFGTLVTPKSDELIASQYRHAGSKEKASDYFEEGFRQVFASAAEVHNSSVPLTFFYAFKQAEKQSEGLVSTGWSTMLEGLMASGWIVTATWPMRTEMATKLNMGANLLAGSVVLACRQRTGARASVVGWG